MPLPGGNEYQMAVQNPHLCFKDTDLRNAKAETTPLGLPKPYSGGFTTTYHLKTQNDSWAVRCFTRDVKDLQIRYDEYGKFFRANKSRLKYLVEAEYLKEGIRIGADFYPIIKMRWIKGDNLNAYIEKNLNNPARLLSLARKFEELIKVLEDNKIAHGDLQHGNILVSHDELYLIDYDGLYLPSLSSYVPNEIGHPNYQHPQRTASGYGPAMDRFSAIIIYSGIIAVAKDQSLWAKYNNGENILFKNSDILDVHSSPLFKDLGKNSELKKIRDSVGSVCLSSFNQIPTLSDFIKGNIQAIKVFVPGQPAVVSQPKPQAPPPPPTYVSPYPVIDGANLYELIRRCGQKVEVIGKFTDHYRGISSIGTNYLFLNIGVYPNHTFTAVIWNDSLQVMTQKGINPINFLNKWVSVVGVIGIFRNKPQIYIDNPTQIQVLKDEQEALWRLGRITAGSNYISSPAFSTPAAPVKMTATVNVVPASEDKKKDDFFNNYYGSSKFQHITVSGSSFGSNANANSNLGSNVSAQNAPATSRYTAPASSQNYGSSGSWIQTQTYGQTYTQGQKPSQYSSKKKSSSPKDILDFFVKDNVMEYIIRLALIFLLIGSFFKVPYDYYAFLRYMALFGFSYLAFRAYSEKNYKGMAIYIVFAILYDPIFFKLSFSKYGWQRINVGAIGAAIYGLIFKLNRNRKYKKYGSRRRP